MIHLSASRQEVYARRAHKKESRLPGSPVMYCPFSCFVNPVPVFPVQGLFFLSSYL